MLHRTLLFIFSIIPFLHTDLDHFNCLWLNDELYSPLPNLINESYALQKSFLSFRCVHTRWAHGLMMASKVDLTNNHLLTRWI